MDWIKSAEGIKEAFGKYKFVLLILCVGILLMTIPSRESEKNPLPATESEVEQKDIVTELSDILGQIQGVGKVRVMITEAVKSETIYQTDQDKSQDADTETSRTETVIISQNGSERGLVRTVTPPVYLGAIVVCQGGADPRIRLAVTQAVAAVTGIGTDHITVLKMK